MNRPHEVVVVGGGFAGLAVAKGLNKANVRLTLIDRRNHHLFQPLLYQVATGGLSPADISSPIRALLKKQKNARVLLGNVVDINTNDRRVKLADGNSVDYDTLVVATGANHAYFGQDHWEADAPGLKTLEDATRMRTKVLGAFERAERAQSKEERDRQLRFVIVGAGPTGVELAGALGELAKQTLKHDFREIDPGDAEILLLDASDRVLPSFSENASGKALEALEKLGVKTRTGVKVTDINEKEVVIQAGESLEVIPTRTVLWAAGIRASVLGPLLAERTGAKIDRMGRLMVEEDFSLPGHPEIMIAGDLAYYDHINDAPLPGTAAVAQQEGVFIGKNIAAKLDGRMPKPFSYTHYGDLAVIGRSEAVAEVGKMRLSGNSAWWFWLLVHLIKLVDMSNRMLVLVQWSWSYFTRKRSARLLTQSADVLLPVRVAEDEEQEHEVGVKTRSDGPI